MNVELTEKECKYLRDLLTQEQESFGWKLRSVHPDSYECVKKHFQTLHTFIHDLKLKLL